MIGGGSYYSQSDLAVYFGLGDAVELDRVTVTWPSGSVQEFEGVQVNRRYRLIEGGKLEPLTTD